MPKVILVTTAGKVGSEAARLLTQRQVPVRVLVRDPEKGKAMADAGVEIAVGDLDIPESINQAMAGVTSVVLVSPAVPAQELNVIASAARAGIEHVVKATSKASADSPIARRRGQAEIEAGLAASGLPHTLLRSNAYMQNTLALAPVIAKTSSFGSSAAKGLVGMVDARDVGAVAAEIAASPAPHAGKTSLAGTLAPAMAERHGCPNMCIDDGVPGLPPYANDVVSSREGPPPKGWSFVISGAPGLPV